jgi:rRNA-processing protein EBP2
MLCPKLIHFTERKGQDTGTVNEGDDLFENIDIEDSSGKPDRRNGPGNNRGSNSKRQKRDQKFGYGGKKRFAKSGDATSTADMRGFSTKRMKSAGGGTRAKKRLGKSRRAAASR